MLWQIVLIVPFYFVCGSIKGTATTQWYSWLLCSQAFLVNPPSLPGHKVIVIIHVCVNIITSSEWFYQNATCTWSLLKGEMKMDTIVVDNPVWCCTNTSYRERHTSHLDSMLAGSDWQSSATAGGVNRFYDLPRRWVGDWSTKNKHKFKNTSK